MKKINLSTWNRRDTYLFFKDFDYPKFSITVDLDITNFYHYVKKHSQSFYLSMIHLMTSELNKMENFRYRIDGDDVYLIDLMHPSFTDTIPGTDQFKIVNTRYLDSVQDFMIEARRKSEIQGSQFIHMEDEKRSDFVYITTFPWAKFSQVTHAYHHAKDDSIPRVVWGKFEEINAKLIMPFSIEVHHGCVDGLHVGLLIENIQNRLNSF
ncbi:MAG: CatA-like O-acetyltransferase [Acholeplasmataceae bacterium]|jgi:chloramphenicol O-acetyltransferase type A|nr:CatA-like O-acetyltransferase [Acholeplasmataceae bacterium]